MEEGTMKSKWWIVGALVFVTLLVCAGIILVLWNSRVALDNLRLFYRTDTHIEETLDETFIVDGPVTLNLESDFSSATVTGSDQEQVAVFARMNLWGSDEEDARSQLDVQLTQEGNHITIRVERSETIYILTPYRRGSTVDFEIRVPFETSLQLINANGDLTVKDIDGRVELTTSFGDIRVEDVNGIVSTQSNNGDITLIGVSEGGDMNAETKFGDVDLQELSANSLMVRSQNGTIQVEGVTVEGVLDLQTKFGLVTLQDVTAERLTAHSDNGGVRAERVELEGALDLESNFGDVTAEDVQALSYRLKSNNGNLTLHGCSGPLDLQTNFGEIEVKDATEANLTLKTKNGKVYFSGSLASEGIHSLESEFGGIQLVLPSDSAFDLDAETKFGSIRTDFSVTMQEFEEKHIIGQVNGGGAILQIYTRNGNINLESLGVDVN
jgi:DUF4097 and DUF4098 domain-containing protein YvlB